MASSSSGLTSSLFCLVIGVSEVMKLIVAILLLVMTVGCGGSSAPIPPENPTPPPGTASLGSAKMDGGEEASGNTKKPLGEN